MKKKFIDHFTNNEMLLTSIGIFLILFFLFLIGTQVFRLLNRFTFNREVPNPYRSETLGLPNGTLRGVLTLSLLVVVIIMICMSMVVKSLQGTYDHLLSAFEVMLAFYFGSKIMSQVAEKEKEKVVEKSQADAEKARAESTTVIVDSSEKADGFFVEGSSG